MRVFIATDSTANDRKGLAAVRAFGRSPEAWALASGLVRVKVPKRGLGVWRDVPIGTCAS